MSVRSARNRPRYIVASVLLLVVVSLLAYVVMTGITAPRETADQVACRGITELNQSRNDASQPVWTGGGAPIVVLGDSYAQGANLPEPRAQSWPTVLGREVNRTVWVNAVGSTGYVNQGRCGGQDYAARVQDVLLHQPGLVIVQGGLNDSSYPPDQVQAAVSSLLAKLRPVPHVLLVGPTRAPAADMGELERVDGLLKFAAAGAGRPYVSGLTWPISYGPDGIHPTINGQTAFARRVNNSITDTNS